MARYKKKMKPMDWAGRWVLVTGASSGLGLEMARQLGMDQGANLILVARREERLEALAEEIRSAGREVRVVAADLCIHDDVARVIAASKEVPLYGAIFNAGITHLGHWHALEHEQFQRMLELNVGSVVRLTSELVPHVEQQGGGVLLVSSMAGLAPLPYQAAYSGMKAFLVHYGCSIWHELEGRNVSVTTFCPGGIRTEMTEGGGFDGLRSWLMPVDVCASSALSGFRKRKYLHVPGLTYSVLSKLQKLAPEPFTTSRVAVQYRTSLAKADPQFLTGKGETKG